MSWLGTKKGLEAKTHSTCLFQRRSEPGQQVKPQGTGKATRMEQWARYPREKGVSSWLGEATVRRGEEDAFRASLSIQFVNN